MNCYRITTQNFKYDWKNLITVDLYNQENVIARIKNRHFFEIEIERPMSKDFITAIKVENDQIVYENEYVQLPKKIEKAIKKYRK